MSPSVRRYRALLLCLCCLLACTSGPEDFSRCSGGLTITVKAAVQPEFSWTPADCPVYEIGVEDAGKPLWSLVSAETVNRVQSPVRYGQVASAGQFYSPGPGAAAPPLIQGTLYVVRLWRLDPNSLITVAGELTFQYHPGQ